MPRFNLAFVVCFLILWRDLRRRQTMGEGGQEEKTLILKARSLSEVSVDTEINAVKKQL
jgi:hypothetical protein